MQLNPTSFILALATVLAVPAVVGNPLKGMGMLDQGGLENKIRSGSVAVANRQQPRDERNSQVSFHNGKRVSGENTTPVTDSAITLFRREAQPSENDCTFPHCDDISMKRCGNINNQCYSLLGCFDVVSYLHPIHLHNISDCRFCVSIVFLCICSQTALRRLSDDMRKSRI
jgi:hypothetical protein